MDRATRAQSWSDWPDLTRPRLAGFGVSPEDIVRAELRSPEIVSARVVGHGVTQEAAFEPIRELGEQYPRFAIRYTGVCTEPLIRPSLVIDDDSLALLAEPLKRPSLARR
jgi:hypothetical protein